MSANSGLIDFDVLYTYMSWAESLGYTVACDGGWCVVTLDHPNRALTHLRRKPTWALWAPRLSAMTRAQDIRVNSKLVSCRAELHTILFKNYWVSAPASERVEGVHNDMLWWLLDPQGWR